MAEGKKAFVVYTNWKEFLDVMNDRQKGQWLNWVMDYCNDLNPELPKDQTVCMAIKITQPILKRDLKKYEEKLDRFKKNAKQYRDKIDTDIGADNDTELGGDNSNKLIVNSNKIHSKECVYNITHTPTHEDIENYIKLKSYNVDSKKFYSYYQARGWNTVSDWKAMIDYWNNKDNQEFGIRNEAIDMEEL